MDGLLADTTFWVAVGMGVFLVIVFAMGGFGAMGKALDARSAAIKAELDEARRLREEAQALLSQYQRRARDAEREAEEIVSAAKLEAERMASDTRQQLDELIRRRTAVAEQKIAQAEAEALAEVRQTAVAAAVNAAQLLIAQRLDESRADMLADTAIAELRAKLH